MSDLTVHLQYEPDWLPNFVAACDGKLRTIKGVNCYPNLSNVRTIGRVYVDDNLSNALVMQGAGGVDQWIYLCRGEYEKARHVYAWQGPNEFIIDSYEKSARWNEFHIVYIRKMSELGLRVMAGNINVGWPRLQKFSDPPPYPPALRPTIETLVQHDGILSLHEYGPGDMRQGQGAHCLRYRATIDALRKANVPIPRVFIGETGIDVPDPAFPLDHHHRGWTEWTDRAGYLEQLRWYAGELAQDDYIIGAAVFTVCNWDWLTFNVDRDLAMGIAEIVRWEPEIVSPVIPPDAPEGTAGVPFDAQDEVEVVYMVGKMPTNPDAPYEKRFPEDITHTVIHHTGFRGHVAKPRQHLKAIARYHIRKYGWPGAAYHYCIDKAGTIYQTTHLGDICYHSGSRRMNERSVAVCFFGMEPNRAQLDAMRRLCDWLGYTVIPHQDVVPTACPGKWRKWGKEITG